MFSRQERVDIFMSRFHGRRDVFARRWKRQDGASDHYALAMQAANLALEYYQGQSREDMKQAILDGFSRFSDVQTEFMKSLSIHGA